MGNAKWHTRPPADSLLEAGADGGKVGEVGHGGHAVAADAIDLILRLLLPFGVECHRHEEELAGAANGDDTDEVEETDHAAGKDFLVFGLVDVLVVLLALDLLEVAVGPGVVGKLAAPELVLGETEVVEPPGALRALALDLELVPRVHESGQLPKRADGVDDGSGNAHAVEGLIGTVAIGLALCSIVPGEARHDTATVLTGVVKEASGIHKHETKEALHLHLDVSVEVMLVGLGHGGMAPLALGLPDVCGTTVRSKLWEHGQLSGDLPWRSMRAE